MKRTLKMLLLVFFLLIIYIYTFAISTIPNQLVVFEGENVTMRILLGMNVKEKGENTVETAATSGSKISESVGKKTLNINLFNALTLKNIDVNVLPKTTVIPVGNIAGVKLYTNGVLVVGMSEIEGKDSKKYKPYENTGIKEGDTIIKVNDKQIDSTEDLVESVNMSNGSDVKIKYLHEEETKECSMTPVQTTNEEYKLGLWVRDSAAGVGTVTFYEPSSKTFGALGHGITDIDTNELINIASGEFITTRILSITKGEKGEARENPRDY